jgi:hypothetical protein
MLDRHSPAPVTNRTVHVPIDEDNEFILPTFQRMFTPHAASTPAHPLFVIPIMYDRAGPFAYTRTDQKYRAKNDDALQAFVQDSSTYTAMEDSEVGRFTIRHPNASSTLYFYRQGTKGYGDALPHYQGHYDAIYVCVCEKEQNTSIIVTRDENGKWRFPREHEITDAKVSEKLSADVYAFDFGTNIESGYTFRVYASRLRDIIQLEEGQDLVKGDDFFYAVLHDGVDTQTMDVTMETKFRDLFARKYLEIAAPRIPTLQKIFPLVAHTLLPSPRFNAVVYYTYPYDPHDGQRLRTVHEEDPSDTSRMALRLPRVPNTTHASVLALVDTEWVAWFAIPGGPRVYVAAGHAAQPIEAGDADGAADDIWIQAKLTPRTVQNDTRTILGNIMHLRALIALGIAPPRRTVTTSIDATLHTPTRKRPAPAGFDERTMLAMFDRIVTHLARL